MPLNGNMAVHSFLTRKAQEVWVVCCSGNWTRAKQKAAVGAEVVRVFRVVKFFRSLRTLVQSLLGTMKALFWAMLLLALIIYIFAIVFTDAVIDHVQDLQVVKLDDDVLEAYFGTLYDSYLTLFRSISNGVTWGEPASALSSIPEGHFACSVRL